MNQLARGVSLAWERLCVELDPYRWNLDAPRLPFAGLRSPVASHDELVEALTNHLSGCLLNRDLPPVLTTYRGNPELAWPAVLRLSCPGDDSPPVVVRLRYLPQNFYRAMGYILKIEGDCRRLRREARAGRESAACVGFVDAVGVVSPEQAAAWRDRYAPVGLLGWSARWGRLR